MEKTWFVIVGGIVGSALTYLGIQNELFYLLCSILIIDLITGVLKGFAHKELKSETMIQGIIKKTSILLLILSAAIMIKILGFDPVIYLGFAFGGFAMAEFYSILGNVYAINTGEKYNSEFNAIKFILGGLLKFFQKKIENQVSEKIQITEQTVEKKENNISTNKEV